ncbi:histidine--tRNA ligase [Georgenia sp. Z1344]|uniref:histidine--tRNA ligase n=1 Tax=Georgenia sp. Z1344 TaxID=3416706 RepID=UPI003CF0AD77
MARTSSLSGFPEWLPDGRIVENHVLDTLRHTFELHGFAPIETRSVEPVEQLLAKGETSKEIYLLSRLQADAEGTDDDARADGGTGAGGPDRRLGLHFDLTVPFARWVVEHAGDLAFPFRRYQIQKVWRGERPQDGRFREFTQADVDIVGDGTLAEHHEAELALVMAEAIAALPVPPARVRVNNRKLSQGFYAGIGLTDVDAVLRAIDKLDKIGPDAVARLLQDEAGASEQQAEQALALAAIRGTAHEVEDSVRGLGVRTDLLEEGLDSLIGVLSAAERRRPDAVVGDLSIARGLDYYTGTVYETTLLGHEDLGSICSGGRYDSLASAGNRTFPGAGLSIGVSRLVARILGADLARASRPVPSAVLVAVADEAHRSTSDDVAAALRARDIPVEVAPSAAKFGKQIRHADRRSIPFVWFVGDDGHEVKDIRSGGQVPADPATWEPPAADRWPSVSATAVEDGS